MTSHRPYYATMDQLAKPVHSRGDGLSSTSFAGQFIAFSVLKFALMGASPLHPRLMSGCQRLRPWPGREIARTRATRVRTTAAEVPSQEVLLKRSIKDERCLTGRLLDRKREVALRIDGSREWI